jgi:hypothetical protein
MLKKPRILNRPRTAAVLAIALLGSLLAVLGPASPAAAALGDCWNAPISGVMSHTCHGDQWLSAGQSWYYGKDNRARLTMQVDGNLVIYDTRPSTDKAVWSTHTDNSSAQYMFFGSDGWFALSDNVFGGVYWAPTYKSRCPSDRAYVLALQDDSNVAVYCHKTGSYGTAIWASNTVF